MKLNDADVETKLDFSKPINFIIHGFMADTKWMFETADVWTKNTSCNVCAVDWSPLAGDFKISIHKLSSLFNRLIAYPQVSMLYTRLTSNVIVRFMKFLEQHGMKIDQVSIAGHSLGAHISGFVGAAFHGQIHAIYGTF